MFFCEPCRTEREWPNSISKSRGRCECCGNSAVYNDVPSRFLPVPKRPVIVVPAYKAKHRKD